MKNMLKTGADALGLNLPDGCEDKLIKYSELLTRWNEKMNLTAITEPDMIVSKHFLDSLTPLCTGKVTGRVIDVGTGAGFPGIVLKLAKPDISLTLLDSLNKRLTFLKAVCEETGLSDVEFVHSRAEDGGQNRLLRESFDTVTARAVANMTLLSELCLPFVKPGGYFLALKGPMAENELDEAKRAISILGGEVESVYEAKIPFTDLAHKIIIIKKIKKTPTKYPRKPGIISKTPIESCYSVSKKHRK